VAVGGEAGVEKGKGKALWGIQNEDTETSQARAGEGGDTDRGVTKRGPNHFGNQFGGSRQGGVGVVGPGAAAMGHAWSACQEGRTTTAGLLLCLLMCADVPCVSRRVIIPWCHCASASVSAAVGLLYPRERGREGPGPPRRSGGGGGPRGGP